MQKWLFCQRKAAEGQCCPVKLHQRSSLSRYSRVRCIGMCPQSSMYSTGPSHSLHARAVAALFACSHSIYRHKRLILVQECTNSGRHGLPFLLLLTCTYLVLSA